MDPNAETKEAMTFPILNFECKNFELLSPSLFLSTFNIGCDREFVPSRHFSPKIR